MIVSLLAFIAIFTLIVVVHEFGHFVTARKAGIKVYEFSIGFPFSPRLFTLFRHKETAFTVRLLPIGGFVSFSQDGDEDTMELFEASVNKRALVLSAGSLFNIIFALIVFVPVFAIGKHLNLIDAIGLSVKTVWEILSGTIMFILNIFTGHGAMDGLSGPVGIAAMAGQAASKGILNLFYFTGVLSVSLGIMNLLPLPALDGGHLIMLFIESIRKKPLSLKTYQVVTLVGLSLFLVLTIVVTYKDVAKLIA
ncbi:MAG TPA: site-2 protease family protein [Candidatus Nanoarchaeia archaeon]|nr:site-2 protease family protein [Candidatus Nanoarchaeia archaeon]